MRAFVHFNLDSRRVPAFELEFTFQVRDGAAKSARKRHLLVGWAQSRQVELNGINAIVLRLISHRAGKWRRCRLVCMLVRVSRADGKVSDIKTGCAYSRGALVGPHFLLLCEEN